MILDTENDQSNLYCVPVSLTTLSMKTKVHKSFHSWENRILQIIHVSSSFITILNNLYTPI